MCKVSADCAVPSVIVGFFIGEMQVIGIRTRAVSIEVSFYCFTRSSYMRTTEVLALSCLEEV